MPQFELPSTTDLDRFTAELAERLGSSPEPAPAESGPPAPMERTYYDTFDGRLYRAGLALVGDRLGDASTLRLERRGTGGHQPIRQVVTAPPRFVGDLPAGRLRTGLAPIVEMRALLPQVRLETAVRRLCLRNEDGKTEVRLTVERHHLGEGEAATSWCRLKVEPLRGYGKAQRRVLGALEQQLGLEPTSTDLLTTVLAAQNRRLDGYSSRIEVTLEPDLRADAAVKRILAEQCDTMLANLDGMRDEVDTEFLHDFRVAVRRSRSALSRIRGVLPKPRVARFRRDLRWLGQLTGPARDYDVYLLEFDTLTAELPEGLDAHLGPLRALLADRRSAAYDRLRAGLGSRRGRQLLDDFAAFVAAPVPQRSGLPQASRPILEVARQEIWRAYRRVRRQGDGLAGDRPADELHELRKRCKALRYLLEFFKSLFDDQEMAQLITELKGLQKILGSFQDLQVQSTAAAEWGLELATRPGAGAPTTLALGALTERLSAQQEQVRRRCDLAYRRFVSKQNRKRARRLFRDDSSRKSP